MARRKTSAPIRVLISGATQFQYDESWLDWAHRFAISLSPPLRAPAYQGASVVAVFDNLLPDNPNIRHRVAERTGAQMTDAYSLLEQIEGGSGSHPHQESDRRDIGRGAKRHRSLARANAR